MRGGLPFSFWGDWGLPWNVLKIYVSESAFQAILKPIFPYSITSILSKIRHSKKSNRKAMNRNWSNQKANPALKTKAGTK